MADLSLEMPRSGVWRPLLAGLSGLISALFVATAQAAPPVPVIVAETRSVSFVDDVEALGTLLTSRGHRVAVGFIVSIMAVIVVAVGISAGQQRAYYLAYAGLTYYDAQPVKPTLPQTYRLANGDRFILDAQAIPARLTSTGVVEGPFGETRYRLVARGSSGTDQR